MPEIGPEGGTACRRWPYERNSMSIVVEVRGEYIQLDQLLKTTGLCHSGGYAHSEIEAGNVLVDGVVETRKRAKLRPGQQVAYGGEIVDLVPGPAS
jgi:ribosome-associated protein